MAHDLSASVIAHPTMNPKQHRCVVAAAFTILVIVNQGQRPNREGYCLVVLSTTPPVANSYFAAEATAQTVIHRRTTYEDYYITPEWC